MALEKTNTWNADKESSPSGSDTLALVDDKIRGFKTDFRKIMWQEHKTDDGSSIDASTSLQDDDDGNLNINGEHYHGSAKAYYQDSEPSNKPNGAGLTASADNGRLWVDTSHADGDEIKLYSGGWTSQKVFSNGPVFPNGIQIGASSDGGSFSLGTGTFGGGFLGTDGNDRVTCSAGLPSPNGNDALIMPGNGEILPDSDNNGNLGTSGRVWSEIHGNKVYGAVGNDFADEIEGAPEEIIYGKCYVVGDNGTIEESSKKGQKGTLGVASNTASFTARNNKIEGNKIPIAVGGFVLAYVDRWYPSGTALTSSPGGTLTKAGMLLRILHPERIVGWFVKDPGSFWGTHVATDRFVVKVR